MLKTIYRISIALTFLFLLSPRGTDAQIVPGVLQSAAQTAAIMGTIMRSDGTPVAGADVRLNGSGARLVAKSDVHGAFTFTSVPYGIYRIDANVVGLGIVSQNVIVKGDINVTIQYGLKAPGELKTIAQVSTRNAGASINITPASIASVNPSDYAFQGNSSWKELLDQIPGVTVGGNLFGGSSAVDVIPDSPVQPIVLSINGALPYETSVTLDGMPFINVTVGGNGAVGGGTDLSFVPMPMFDTADVVRGPGANAPSIVDSIGGSFVLHAPGLVDGNHFEFSMSNDPYGGIVSNAKAAFRFGRLSATIVYGVNDSPGPLGKQTGITADSYTPTSVNGQAFNGCSPSAPFFGSCSNQSSNTSQYQNCYCEFQDALLFSGVPMSTAWTQHEGAAALSYAITPSITAQVFYAGASSEVPLTEFGYAVNFMPGSGYAGSIAPGSYRYIYTLGPSQTMQASSLLEEKVTAYAGRGVLRLAALQDNSFSRVDIPNFLPNGQYMVYGTGYYAAAPTTPANFNGTSEYLTFTPFHSFARYWANNRDLLASYATQVGSASDVSLSYVTSYYNSPYSSNGMYNVFSFSSSQPPAVSETTSEFRLYAGTELSDRLSLGASWYFAKGMYHVQDPSDPTRHIWADATFPYSAPRFGAVWHASRDIAVRVAAGGGYALPALQNLVGSNAIYLCGPFYEEFKTNLNLTPEKSFGFDVGADMRLRHDTVLSLDLYRVNLYGQFFSSVALTGTYNGLPLYTSETGNLAQSRFEGINVDIHHNVLHGVYWHGALGLTRAYVVSVPEGFYNNPTVPCTNCANTYIIPGSNFNGYFGTTVPYASGTAQLGYRWNPSKYLELSPTYFGNGNPYFEPAFVEFDAHASYPLTRNVSLLATFKNITGIYDQNYEYRSPSIGVPTMAGMPYPLFGLPFGPRTAIVTVNFKY